MKAPFGFHLLGETFDFFSCLYYTSSSGVIEAYILLSLMIIGTYPIIRVLKEMVDFFQVARLKMKKAFFLFLSPVKKTVIETQMERATIPRDCFSIKEVPYDDVPKWLSYADVSIFFNRPLFSKKGSCPTKLAESLACGLPVIVNSGVGDYDEIVEKEKVGVVIREFSFNSYAHALDALQRLLENRDVRNRCRDVVKNIFL